MELSDYYPLILVVAVIVAAIAALRIFFTLWEPIERRINGDKRKVPFSPFDINELKDKPVNIHLKSGVVIDGAVLLGYCSPPPAVPYDFRHLLKAQLADGTTAYIRLSEIEYLDERSGNT
jgi:hypothetical protein